MSSARVNILILRGVTLGDFTSEKTYNTTPRVAKTIETEIQYDSIPSKFTGIDAWPKNTNLKCWECSLVPTGFPKFIPVNLGKTAAGTEQCDPHGNFCEWNCVIKYILKEFPHDQQWDALQAVYLYEGIITGKHKKKIQPAPPKTQLKEYCGPNGMTVQQYRNSIEELNKHYDLSHYKMEHFCEVE